MKNIIIPETLDGQTVIGIADGEYQNSIFYGQGITTIKLPTTIQYVGEYAFHANSISELDLSGCSVLTSIRESSFWLNNLSSIDFSDCVALDSIGDRAFKYNKLTSLDLSNCTKLKLIGYETFFDNNLETVNISGCKSLLCINYAFKNNYSLAGFHLPNPIIPDYFYSTWNDDNGNLYNAGDEVTNLSTNYLRTMPVITEVAPVYTATSGNTEITITGNNFETQKNNKQVLLGGIEALDYTFWSDSLITVICPPNPEGTAEINITLENGIDYTSPKGLYYSDNIDYEACGEVSGTWEAGKTYFLTCNVTIPEGSTLTIEEGVKVIVLAGDQIKLESKGTLKVIGTIDNPIIFSSTTGLRGSWSGVQINQEGIINYANISDAMNGISVAYDKTVDIMNCKIIGNSQNGIYIGDSGDFDYYGVRISNSVIEKNGEFGIYYYSVTEGNTDGTVEHCIIRNNKMGGIKILAQGGSVGIGWVPAYKMADCNPTIQNNKIFNNLGPGIFCSASGFTSSSSGAVRAARVESKIFQNLVYNNSGGGIYFYEAAASSYNNTEVYNNTFWNNGNIGIDYQSGEPTIANNIFWGDTEQLIINVGDSLKINYCNIMQDFPGVGNVYLEPLFVNTNEGDFSLQEVSPCIDAGSNEFVDFETDFEGKIRIWDGNDDKIATVDIGAFEFGAPCNLTQLDTLICFGESYYDWNTSGQYQLTLANQNNCDSVIMVNLTVDEPVEVPTYTQNGDLLSTNATGNIQWYLNGVPISGATNMDYTIDKSGEYQVEITNNNGCSAISAGTWCVKTGINDFENSNFLIYPNPTINKFYILLKQNIKNAELKVFTSTGQQIYNQSINSFKENEIEVSTNDWAKGIYHIQISTKKDILKAKIVIN